MRTNPKPMIYLDSISHRILVFCARYGGVKFTAAQLLAVADVPLAQAYAQGQPIPDAGVRMAASPRSATQQLGKLLAQGLLHRSLDASWRASVDNSPRDQYWYWADLDVLTRINCTLKASSVRPGARIAPGMSPAAAALRAPTVIPTAPVVAPHVRIF